MLGTLTPNFNSSFTFRSRRLRMFVGAAFTEAKLRPADGSSLYEVLRIKRDASQIEIKTAYRTLAKLYHPDATARFMDSSIGRDFMELHDAYATLSDPDARAVYDYNLNVDVRRRWSTAGLRSPGRTRFNLTRTWETDQCW